MADWQVSSHMGFEFEEFILKDLNEKHFPLAYKNMKKEDYCYYDIILFDGDFSKEHKQKTIECKYDEMANQTGNICIETGCNGRLSGLLITKADYWVISDGQTTFLIKTDEIRRCLEEYPNITYRRKYHVLQEDGVTKEMNFYLIPKRIFEKYCLEVNDINKMKYDCLL